MGANFGIVSGSIRSGFNPRTRDGCEGLLGLSSSYKFVSIHAPVMGAKLCVTEMLYWLQVSIHAPVMGAKST